MEKCFDMDPIVFLRRESSPFNEYLERSVIISNIFEEFNKEKFVFLIGQVVSELLSYMAIFVPKVPESSAMILVFHLC